MDKHGPALHVLVFYWCVLLIDVTSMRLGRFLDRVAARRSGSRRMRRAPRGHAGEQARVFIRKSS